MNIRNKALENIMERMPTDCKNVRAWAEKTCTKDRMKQAGLVLTTTLVWALVFFSLNVALHNSTIVGF